ncbi:Helicase-like protein [Corchorus olitorius]|uniref:Helicase-like protein n=1 Tax=Corchorus olitorius TaxID=93759 RepID=A0A1R3JNM4_9ROSI|nr:Helicase-like protein [Corchorus olitorius]
MDHVGVDINYGEFSLPQRLSTVGSFDNIVDQNHESACVAMDECGAGHHSCVDSQTSNEGIVHLNELNHRLGVFGDGEIGSNIVLEIFQGLTAMSDMYNEASCLFFPAHERKVIARAWERV